LKEGADVDGDFVTGANVLDSKTGTYVDGDFLTGANVLDFKSGADVLDLKTGRLYLMDGGEVCWFDKSVQSAGFLFLVLVIFSPVVPTSKILKNKNYIFSKYVWLPLYSTVRTTEI
jgi:hypothetical protein